MPHDPHGAAAAAATAIAAAAGDLSGGDAAAWPPSFPLPPYPAAFGQGDAGAQVEHEIDQGGERCVMQRALRGSLHRDLPQMRCLNTCSPFLTRPAAGFLPSFPPFPMGLPPNFFPFEFDATGAYRELDRQKIR